MNVIDIDRATIQVGGRPVLSEISLSIGASEFVGVLGPNGSGKTTLMRALLGLIQPSAGSVHVFGRPPQRGNPVIGYVPQLRTVLPDLRMRGFASATKRRETAPRNRAHARARASRP